MSKHISLSGLKTLLEPLVYLINKKAERPNWNENDPSSPDYIENRPFYEENDSVEYTVKVTNEFVSYNVPLPSFVEGETYEIAWDGVKYSCVAYIAERAGVPMIGNDIVASNVGTTGGNGEPFGILVFEGKNLIFAETTGRHALGIGSHVIHKIDKKYLPDLPEMTGANIGAPGVGELAEVFNDCSSSAATGYGSHAEGGNGATLTSDELGWDSVKTGAHGAYSHAEGHYTVAQGKASHSEGNCTMANGEASHAEGFGTVVDGQNAHAENYLTKATGNSSHAEGGKTQANGSRSHAEGFATMANGENQHVQGRYNIADITSAHIVGNGNSVWLQGAGWVTTYSNAHTLDWEGNAWYAGDVYVGSTSGTNKDDGSKKLATEEYVDNALSNGSAPDVSGQIEEHNTSSSAHSDIRSSISEALTQANTYTDTAITNKVDKVDGKGLSTNDYTTTEKNKLAGIEAGANAYSLPTASSSTLGGVKIGTGIGISSGVISNSGVRSISTGSTNGTISVNTNGTSAEVAVKGLGSNAYNSTAYLPLAGGTVTGVTTFSNTTAASSTTSGAVKISGGLGVAGNIYGAKVYGAVWNDYAEYRSQNEKIDAGYIVYCDDDGKLKLTTEHLQKFEGVVSDTFGFAIGETDECQTPIAVSGRVLVYCNPEDHFHSGDCVCAGPDGLAYYMTREEIMEYPDRIVGIVSEIPTYETWGSNNIKVNNRIWIRVR